MHENREISGASRSDQDRDRPAKAPSHKAGMHVSEKSDRAEVPMNQPNKGEQSSMEAGEKKGANQGEHRSVPHKPDTERGTSVPRIERCAASSNREGAGTVCSTLSLSICSATAAAIGIDNYPRRSPKTGH